MSALVTKSLTGLGLLLLTHAIYSAYEHSLLTTTTTTTTTATLNNHNHPSRQTSPSHRPTSTTPLPLDITLETLLSTLLLTTAIVLSSSPLRPIRWREWAGRVERDGWEPTSAEGADKIVGLGEGRGGSGNPYRAFEERRGFVDVRKQREEFADWVRSGAVVQGKA